MTSSAAADSLKLSPSGAMSRSWKQKNGTPSFSKNSKAAAILILAASIGSPAASSQGRSRVPAPKMSKPVQLKLCQ